MKLIKRIKQKIQYYKNRWAAKKYFKKLKESSWPYYHATIVFWQFIVESFDVVKYPVKIVTGGMRQKPGIVDVKLSIFQKDEVACIVSEQLKQYEHFLPFGVTMEVVRDK